MYCWSLLRGPRKCSAGSSDFVIVRASSISSRYASAYLVCISFEMDGNWETGFVAKRRLKEIIFRLCSHRARSLDGWGLKIGICFSNTGGSDGQSHWNPV